ncbi:galactose oxidase [Mytilinidion resinicola]|uniref:Galactose oxidase n=1 Tax=Mytilinidion resinicola TaxID=574789 RepID=A0A6A6YRV8_9PEZI|nr:galactose oxidase [Mytilinidion resinicola]KAF2811103.1 galactose oxidase [Mytilinidion resinicola]
MAKSLSIKWQRIIASDTIKRSSQVIAIANDKVHIFGGEIVPREPVGSNVYANPKITRLPGLKDSSTTTQPASPTSPCPRVGSASATINNTAYLFSGRGGTAMSPISEHGLIWSLNLDTLTWTPLRSSDPSAPYPPARNYHTLTSNSTSTLYLHAGCPASGRLSDLWSFGIPARRWTQLASAPDPPRGGTSIVYAAGKLYRLGGFDGTRELGGCVDVYTPAPDSWDTLPFTDVGPEARSVAGLAAVEVVGRVVLLSLFGERDPSSLGYQGAGKMLADVWAYDVESGVWAEVLQEGDGLPEPRSLEQRHEQLLDKKCLNCHRHRGLVSLFLIFYRDPHLCRVHPSSLHIGLHKKPISKERV